MIRANTMSAWWKTLPGLVKFAVGLFFVDSCVHDCARYTKTIQCQHMVCPADQQPAAVEAAATFALTWRCTCVFK